MEINSVHASQALLYTQQNQQRVAQEPQATVQPPASAIISFSAEALQLNQQEVNNSAETRS